MEEEKKLIAKVKEGNRLAFTMVYMEYHKRLYAFAYHYLCDRYLTEDTIQWLFLGLWESRSSLNEQMDLKSYLFTCLRNRILNLLRDDKRKAVRHEKYLQETDVTMDNEAFRYQDEEELRTRLRTAVSALSPQKRRICELKLEGNLSNAEIAEQLQISVNTVKFQYNAIIKELRAKISQPLLMAVSLFLLLS